MFTGDRSGDWLYGALYRFGFANQATSQSRSDGLELLDCAITASCHCAPPGNKPTPAELAACSRWLDGTLNLVPARVIIVLGQVAWRSVIDLARRRHWLSGPSGKFSHGAVKRFADGRWLIASYHPSQQNTFTGRLTQPMFDGIFATARRLLSQAGRHA
jgi:uracil-DNA glycosylase family 4